MWTWINPRSIIIKINEKVFNHFTFSGNVGNLLLFHFSSKNARLQLSAPHPIAGCFLISFSLRKKQKSFPFVCIKVAIIPNKWIKEAVAAFFAFYAVHDFPFSTSLLTFRSFLSARWARGNLKFLITSWWKLFVRRENRSWRLSMTGSLGEKSVESLSSPPSCKKELIL